MIPNIWQKYKEKNLIVEVNIVEANNKPSSTGQAGTYDNLYTASLKFDKLSLETKHLAKQMHETSNLESHRKARDKLRLHLDKLDKADHNITQLKNK